MALSWLFAGGGLELYNEILATGSRSAGSNGRSTASMTCARCGSAPRASAWEMMKTMGVSVVTLAGGEVIPALERGAVEGAEWAIPSHDIVMGFQNVAKNYRHGRPPIELVVTTTGRSSATRSEEHTSELQS